MPVSVGDPLCWPRHVPSHFRDVFVYRGLRVDGLQRHVPVSGGDPLQVSPSFYVPRFYVPSFYVPTLLVMNTVPLVEKKISKKMEAIFKKFGSNAVFKTIDPLQSKTWNSLLKTSKSTCGSERLQELVTCVCRFLRVSTYAIDLVAKHLPCSTTMGIPPTTHRKILCHAFGPHDMFRILSEMTDDRRDMVRSAIIVANYALRVERHEAIEHEGRRGGNLAGTVVAKPLAMQPDSSDVFANEEEMVLWGKEKALQAKEAQRKSDETKAKADEKVKSDEKKATEKAQEAQQKADVKKAKVDEKAKNDEKKATEKAAAKAASDARKQATSKEPKVPEKAVVGSPLPPAGPHVAVTPVANTPLAVIELPLPTAKHDVAVPGVVIAVVTGDATLFGDAVVDVVPTGAIPLQVRLIKRNAVKSKLCKFEVEKKGSCTYGAEKCHFAHGDDDRPPKRTAKEDSHL